MKKLSFLLLVKGLNLTKHMINKYFIVNLYFLIIDDSKLAWLRKELYIVNNLKVKLLIRIDILNPKRFIMNLSRNKIYILIYNIDIPIASSPKRG